MFIVENKDYMPKFATQNSAGLDVFSEEETQIYYNELKIVSLGVKLDTSVTIAQNIHFLLLPRSSMRVKGITTFGAGVIDADYADTIKIVLHNNNEESFIIKKGQAIGQLIPFTFDRNLFKKSLSDFVRMGGFGSTTKDDK